MKTKTIITAVLLLFTITSFAQHLVYNTIEDLETNEKIVDRYHINLYDKKVEIKRENGKKEEYEIKSYTIEKNQEDEDIFGEGKGVKFTEYNIELEEKKVSIYELQRLPKFLRFMLPEKSYANRYKDLLAVKNNYRLITYYFSIVKN